MAKGKWAQGITPRNFCWIITDQIAVAERPGGYGDAHRKVRRTEEIIWLREQGFDFVISLLPATANLTAYDEVGVRWKHWPIPTLGDIEPSLAAIYPQLDELRRADSKILLHTDEVGDRLAGFLSGYLRWSGMVPVTHEAIIVIERIMGRQLGPTGRNMVTIAERLAESGSGD